MNQDLPFDLPEVLNNTQYPILNYYYKEKGFSFENIDYIRIRHQLFSLEEAIGAYYRFYDSHHNLLEYNKLLCASHYHIKI